MVKANGKGKARIPKSKRKTENATPSATTVATASEPVKTDAEALDIVPSVEENKEENKGEEVKEEKGKETSKPVNKSRKRNRIRRKTKNVANTATVKDADKPENSDGDKASNKAESMGMVFMCNSKTKKDCYQYKVLGLPASKKDTVAEIYKGMRLFLFDVDLKLMYGIYKAAGRGGYNIEPKAFKSAFPSQVRFTVLDDCLPLPEEKFKKIIKDNYYGKNKFNCQLNSEQVKNLCKLFRATTKGAKSKRVGRPSRREARTIAERGRSRWPSQDDVRRSPLGRNFPYPEAPRMYEREVFPSPERGRSRWLSHDRPKHSPPLGANSVYPEGPRMYEREAYRVRHSPLGRSALYLEPPSMYEREAYPPQALPPPLLLPPQQHPYAHERPLDMDYYRRETHPEHHSQQVFDLEPRRREITEYRDGYSVYRQPPPYNADSLYSVAPPPAYQLVAPPTQPPLYRY
ncbi:uncharacterized protein LOC122639229 isoform X1 [Telopea speciosissima]|uniref:uncharacterized protein LOC122639229 isoform X1 n=1 Tax=Telopea speciosissima TaxID=54955 RepID=UPI001CC6363D|nr:uncharacterized protein LOC122639229 isoform X1 [Telopea speciosissima]XP_043687994.1 uncharacterized protein LOC122639229 isoform X1 [Telopea speciosissima]